MTSPTPYTNAKGSLSQVELARFACCFLHSKDTSTTGIDWTAAAADFDPKVKAASFKTVTLRALKRVESAGPADGESGGDGDDEGGAVAETGGGGQPAKSKRKASSAPAESKKPAKKGRKGKALAQALIEGDEADAEACGDDAGVKDEAESDDQLAG